MENGCSSKFIQRFYLSIHLVWKHGYGQIDDREAALAALRGDKPKQHGNLEDISEDASIFDLLAEREEVVNEKEFYERVNAFDSDFFVQGNSVEKVTDDTEYSLGGDIDVEVYEAMPKL